MKSNLYKELRDQKLAEKKLIDAMCRVLSNVQFGVKSELLKDINDQQLEQFKSFIRSFDK